MTERSAERLIGEVVAFVDGTDALVVGYESHRGRVVAIVCERANGEEFEVSADDFEAAR